MTPDHAHFVEWDAAYVLGALSPADRRVYEEHLERCGVCRAAIAEIAATTGLLTRIDPARARSMIDAPEDAGGPDESRRAEIIELGVLQARRRRRLTWTGLASAAAAVIVAVVLAATLAIAPTTQRIEVIALEPTRELPLTATVELVDVSWGTRIEMICRYTGDGEGSPEGGWPYALYVAGADGTFTEVSSWRGLPGRDARVSAGTALDSDEISALEVRSLTNGDVLLRTDREVADGAALSED
ncbi:zf-HC2 domain-containing protein [Microbacterium hominis]|uniref:Zf-HC2 domain-containing protein n=1 Tax=Microbacterium hominis TaxID=162426 RepID=A0A7D4Q1V0_9MICO|nr:zf-HC2 domain-containing protein [Microbacterium hominis]QKJ19071.1 zf-HC2 domain-containing protein [Microbacterium hominis]